MKKIFLLVLFSIATITMTMTMISCEMGTPGISTATDGGQIEGGQTSGEQDGGDQTNGVLSFSFGGDDSSEDYIHRVSSPTFPTRFAVSLTNDSGEYSLKRASFDLYSTGSTSGQYLTENIDLPAGTYTLQEFIVYDENDTIIFVTPIVDSNAAIQVDSPIGTGFNISISAGGVTNQQIEIVNCRGVDDLGNYGYETIVLEAVNIFSQLNASPVSCLGSVNINGSLVDSVLDGDILYTFSTIPRPTISIIDISDIENPTVLHQNGFYFSSINGLYNGYDKGKFIDLEVTTKAVFIAYEHTTISVPLSQNMLSTTGELSAVRNGSTSMNSTGKTIDVVTSGSTFYRISYASTSSSTNTLKVCQPGETTESTFPNTNLTNVKKIFIIDEKLFVLHNEVTAGYGSFSCTVFDITSPLMPIEVAGYSLIAGSPLLYVVNDLLFIGGYNRIDIYRFNSDTNGFDIVGGLDEKFNIYNSGSSYQSHLFADENYIFLTDYDGLHIFSHNGGANSESICFLPGNSNYYENVHWSGVNLLISFNNSISRFQY